MNVSTAIKIAIRVYFANSRGFEKQIYDLLTDQNVRANIQTVDFSDINADIYVYYPFEDFTIDALLNCVDALIDDIIAEISGE